MQHPKVVIDGGGLHSFAQTIGGELRSQFASDLIEAGIGRRLVSSQSTNSSAMPGIANFRSLRSYPQRLQSDTLSPQNLCACQRKQINTKGLSPVMAMAYEVLIPMGYACA